MEKKKKKKSTKNRENTTYKCISCLVSRVSLKTRDNTVPVSLKITAAHAFVQTRNKKEAKASATLHSRFCRGRGSSLLAKFTANQSYQLVVVHVYVYTHTYFSSRQETRSAKSRTPISLIKFRNFESFLTYFYKDTSLINYIPIRSPFSLKPIFVEW